MPPTKVDITRPDVSDIIPALVKSACGETPSVFSTPKVITKTAIPIKANANIVAAWSPIRGVRSGLTRLRIIIAVSQKAKMIIILNDCAMNIGKFIGRATNKSKM